MAQERTETKQAIIQKQFKDVIVGKYYNMQMRGGIGQDHDLATGGFGFDPTLFRDDDGWREEYARQKRVN